MKDKPNPTESRFKLLFKKTSFTLLLIVAIASALLIVLNFYTIRILSAARAYINGESQYSKAQKDASAHLINYIYLGNETDYTAFERDISVPIGDHVARLALSTDKENYDDAKKGFLQGKSHPEDIDDLIWLFSSFRNLSMFKNVIGIWAEGDIMVNKLHQLGLQSHTTVAKDGFSEVKKRR